MDKKYEESSVSDESSVSTTDSTATGITKNTTGRISVSSAKFREFDAILLRQKQDADQAAAKASDRISTIERQLHRFNDLETKLSDIQQDISCRFNLFEGRLLDTMKEHIGQSGTNLSTMESRMSKLMSVVEGFMDQKLPPTNREGETTEAATADVLECTSTHGSTDNSNRSDAQESVVSGSSSSEGSSLSASSLGTASIDAESVGIITSPEPKRQRSSRKKKTLPESIRRHLDNQQFSQLQQHPVSDTHHSGSVALLTSPTQTPLQTPTKHIESEDESLLTPRSQTPSPDHTDPESQYTEKPLPPKDTEHLSITGNTSHRRGSRG